ncbi:MAG: phosphatidylglycerol lysyltransferase domain-containing protein [Pseudomonadota bacterium]
MFQNNNAPQVTAEPTGMIGNKKTVVTLMPDHVPEFLHNALEGLKEINLSDKERYKAALEKSPQRIWMNYFPFLLTSNSTLSRSILLGEECGSLCIYLLFHWPRRNRLHLYLPPMPFSQEAINRCFERINTFNDDYSGQIWWISETLKKEIKQSNQFNIRKGDEEFIYSPDTFKDLNAKKFRILRYQLRRAERENHIESRLFTPQDKNECLALLEKWYWSKTNNSGKEINYFYAKTGLQLFEQFSRNDLSGYVYLIKGKIVAFAFGGEIIGKTGCCFLRISDHNYISLGYFVCHHFFKNMQQYTIINDGGTTGLSGLKFIKNNLVPIRTEAIYKARQKKCNDTSTQTDNLLTEQHNTDQEKLKILNGLKSLAIEDQKIFLQCTDKAKKKSWISFFPFLFSFSQRAQSTLYWEIYRGSICLYYLSERASGKTLSLYCPPFPFRSRTLIYAMNKVNLFNQTKNGKITWVEEEDQNDIARLGYKLNTIEHEYIYSKANLNEFLTTCGTNDQITTLAYTHKDEKKCLEILDKWKTGYQENVGKNLKYQLGRSCIQNASQYMDGTLIGEVLLVAGDIQGFCFAGAINSEYASVLVTITAPEHSKLKFFLQASMSQNFSAPLYNISAERDDESGQYLSDTVKPAIIHQMLRARKLNKKELNMFIREVKDINTALFIMAARELGLDVDIVSASYSYCVISDGKKTLHVYHNATSITDVATRRVTHNKYLSQNILKSHGIPVPNAKIFSPQDEDKILAYVERFKPIVIKPVKGSRSVGVTVNPQNPVEVRQAVARIKSDRVMIEQYIYGAIYRILIHNSKILDVLLWLPPYIVGNGLDSLHDLVELKNEYYRKNDLYLIQIDFEFLTQQGFDMGFIPEKGQHIAVHPSHEHYVGGEPVRVDIQTIHPDNIAMFIKTAKISGLTLAGLDFISKDLSVPFSENGACINEINSSPEIWPHFFYEQKEDISAVKAILIGHFSQ